VSAELSERLYPTPTGREFWELIERDLKQGVDGHNPSDRRTEELKQLFPISTYGGPLRMPSLLLNQLEATTLVSCWLNSADKQNI
jgi:hypothetical protein